MEHKRTKNCGSLAPAKFFIVTQKTGFFYESLAVLFVALLSYVVTILGLFLNNIEGVYFIFLYGGLVPIPKKTKKVRRPQRQRSHDPALMMPIYNHLTLHSSLTGNSIH